MHRAEQVLPPHQNRSSTTGGGLGGTLSVMPVDLSDAQWGEVTQGRITSPQGVTFTRRSTRIKRRHADELIAGGTPLVLYYYGGGQLTWFDGPEAQEQWGAVRPKLTATDPRPKRGLQWTGGVWLADDRRQLLVLTGRC